MRSRAGAALSILLCTFALADALSFHAAALTPLLSLLTWSAPSSSRWLALSIDPLSTSHLSLPPDAPSHLIISGALDDTNASDSAFTLCEHDHNQRSNSPSSPSPLCAHATLPALHSSSASATIAGSAEPRWDLDGARLSAEVTRSPVDSSAHRFSWSAARVSTDPAAPPLLYSLFAEWSAHTIDAKQLRRPAHPTAATTDSATLGAASPQPTLQRHSLRMCSARSADQRTQQLHCDVPADRLPRGVELTLHLLTECDFQTIGAEGAAMMPHCLSAVSPELRVTFEPLLEPVSLPAAIPSLSFLAAPGVAQVANDTAVRQALCTFYNQTSGWQWGTNSGWCDSTLPVCGVGTQEGWFGIQCDATGQVIISLNLPSNQLVSLPGGVDVSSLFLVLTQLENLSFETNSNLLLTRLDLTPLSKLANLALDSITVTLQGSQPLLLPSPVCALSVVSLKDTSFAVEGSQWMACTQLTFLDVSYLKAPIPFVVVAYMPLLHQFTATLAALTGDAVGSYGGGLSGGELTLFVLSHLNESTPALLYLDISGSSLPFGLPNATDTFPCINAPLLTTLLLDALPLRSGPTGPAERWLAGMPSLIELSMNSLSHATVNTSALRFASRAIQTWRCDCPIVGSLEPLFELASLSELDLSATGLRSQLPHNVSSTWPGLTVFHCSGCRLFGRLPDFQNLPLLAELYLDGNSLVGPIGTDFGAGSSRLTTVLLSSNLLQGPLPSFCNCANVDHAAFDSNLIEEFPDLSCWSNIHTLLLQNNPLHGNLPSLLWAQLPSVTSLVLSHTFLNGSIPDRPVSSSVMTQFLANDCSFTGRIPRNINCGTLDLSNNRFEGSLILFDERFVGVSQMQTVRLASAGTLSCPIQMDAAYNLQSLTISGNGFNDCDWNNVTVPGRIEQLDISDNNFRAFDLAIPEFAAYVLAARANIRGVVMNVAGGSAMAFLTELVLDGNVFAPFNSAGFSVFQQITYLLGDTGLTIMIRVFSCQGCGLSFDIGSLMPILAINGLIEVVRLSDNAIWSQFPTLSQYDNLQLTFPLRITEFSIARNPGIRGRLPSVDTVFQGLTLLDFSGTSVEGAVPSSFANLPALTQLSLTNTSLQCHLVITTDEQLKCDAQSATVLAPSQTTTIEVDSLADPSAGVHCSALTIAATGSTAVSVEPSLHGFTLCTCDSESFGVHAHCFRCPDGCTCTQSTIRNCFPVIQRGSISVTTQIGIGGEMPVIAGSIAPFTVTAILPCPRTVTGSSLCNPDGIAWPSFYRIVETAEAGSVSAVLADSDSSSPSNSEIDLSDWCYPGHTGRLCAACSSGYFSSGRWCLKCLSEGVHVLILVVNVMLIIALIAYLYVKSPGVMNAAKSLQLYSARLLGSSIDAASRSMRSLRGDGAASANIDAPESFSGQPAADAANPLKLLIFHSQQLSLLLHTSTSLPAAMTGLLSVMSSGSTGFSLSSLIAMECLSSKWTLSARCWAAVFAPVIVGLVAVVGAILSPKRGADSRSMQLQGRNEPLLAADSEAAAPSSAVVPRIYSVCASLLYFLFFPCAQTVLSAVACTDTRESDRSYLNLFPTQACDDEWRRTILPPAVIGLMFWIVAFPLGSTMMLMRLRARVAASSDSDSVSASAALSASSASVLSLWPVCSDLLLPYSPRFWFWDQLLLLRRLLLVGAVTLIPSSSLYLPLVLFAIIQLSALQQHWAAPYAHPLLNAGELASLYLLLINYISAIILQSGLTDGGFHATADGWAAALFLVNCAFLLVLLAGLFGFARQWLGARWDARKRQRL